MGRRPAICNQITGFLPLYKNIVNYTKSMFCIVEGRLTILARHILYNSGQTAQRNFNAALIDFSIITTSNRFGRDEKEFLINRLKFYSSHQDGFLLI